MSADSIRDLRWLGRCQRDALLSHVRATMAAWASHWMSAFGVQADDAFGVSLVDDGDLNADNVSACVPLMSWSSASQQLLLADLLGLQGGKSLDGAGWLGMLSDTCVADLKARLLPGDEQKVDAEQVGRDLALAPFSGFAIIRIERWRLSWLLSPELIAEWTAASSRALQNQRKSSQGVELSRALGRARVTLSVDLGETLAVLSDVMALSEGDVVRFPASLSASLPVKVCGLDSALYGDLGQQTGGLALRLASAKPASTPTPTPTPTPTSATAGNPAPALPKMNFNHILSKT